MVGTVLALCLVLSVAAWWIFVKTHYETVIDNWFRATAQVSADGRSITVSYTGGVCGRETSEIRVDETAERVELTIVTKREITGEPCPDVGVLRSITARLEQSLGDRKLVDGHCAHPDWGTTYACPPR
jgi:hypothetical protein